MNSTIKIILNYLRVSFYLKTIILIFVSNAIIYFGIKLFINNYNKKNHILEILFNGINFEIRTDDVLYNRFDKIFNSVPLLYPHLVKYFKNGINDAKKYIYF